jgi:hypothetical protein
VLGCDSDANTPDICEHQEGLTASSSCREEAVVVWWWREGKEEEEEDYEQQQTPARRSWQRGFEEGGNERAG